MKPLLFAAALVVLGSSAAGAVPLPPNMPLVDAELAGVWRVEFANGVVEKCEIRKDATAAVEEPLRSAKGKITRQDGAVVILFEDDRLERWTPVGPRFVVEHWFPASQLPTATPVLGIAQRGP